MANGADGSIVIDTQLDNTGFQRGSQQMEHAVSSLNNSVNQIGQNLQSAVQSMNTALQNMGSAAQTAGSKFTQYLGAGQFDKAMGEAQRSAQALVSDLVRIGNAEMSGVKPGAQYEGLVAKIQNAGNALNTLKGQMDQLAAVRFDSQAMIDLQKQYDEMAAKYEEAKAKLNEMRELGFGDENLKSYIQKCTEIENEIDAIAQKMIQLDDSGQSFTTGADTEEYQRLSQSYTDMTRALEVYRQAAAQMEQTRAPAEEAAQGVEQLNNTVQQSAQVINSANIGYSAFKSHLAAVGRVALTTTKALASMAVKGFKAVGTGVKNAISAIGRYISSLKNMRKHNSQGALSANGLARALVSMKQLLIGRIKSTFISTLFEGLRNGIQSFAKYSATFNAAISGMKNSMTGLSGNIAVFAGNLINTLAPAIITIIDWLSKAMSYINAFVSLLSGKGTFTVAKKGTADYAKSLDSTKSSAGGASKAVKELKNEVFGFDELNKASGSGDTGSGGGSGGSAGGADDGVEFMEKSISSLPPALKSFMDSIKSAFKAGEFEKIGETLGSGLNIITNKISTWIDRIRPLAVLWTSNITRTLNGLVEGIDWEGIGGLFSKGFNLWMEIIGGFLKEFDFEELGKGFASGMNGLFSGINWTNLGENIANGVKGIRDTLHGFFTEFDFAGLAQGFTEGLNNCVSNLELSSLGAVVAEGVNGIIATLNTFFTTFDFASLADELSGGVNGLFDNVDWALLGETVGKGISGVVDLITDTLIGINWVGLGQDLALGTNTLFASIDWEKHASDISESLKGVISAINKFLEETDWQAIGDDAAKFLSGIDWAGLVSSLTEGIGLAVGSIGELIWGLIKPGWDSVVGWWNETMTANGGDVIKTLLDGIVTALTNIETWVHDNIIKPLISGLEKALGLEEGTIGQTATQLWEFFKTSVETAWTTISGAVSEFFTGVWQSITGFFGTLGETAQAIWNGFVEGVSAKWEEIKGEVSSIFTGAWETITGFFGTLGEVAQAIWTGFVDGVSAKWEEIKGEVSGTLTTAWSLITGAFGSLSDIAGTIWDGFSTALSTAWTNVSGAVTKVFTDAWDAIKGAFTNIGDVATNLWEGLKNGLTEGWEKLKDTILQPFRDMWDAVKKFFGIASPSTEAASIGDFILKGLSQGLLDGVAAVLKTVADVFGRIWDAIKAIFGFGGGESEESKDSKQAGADIMSGLSEGVKGNENLVKDEIKKAAQEALKSFRTEFGLPESGSGDATKTKEFGKGIVTGIAAGIKEKATDATFSDSAKKVSSAAESAFKTDMSITGSNSNPTAGKYKYIGWAICKGVAEGIEENKGCITTAVQDACYQALLAAEGCLGISSPSKVFAEIGDYMMQGMAVGLEDGEPAVSQTISDIAESITEGMGGHSLQLGMDSAVTGMDGVADKLLLFVDQLDAASAALARGYLHQPAIADGSYTPPRTRIDTADTFGGMSDMINEMRRQESGRDEYMALIRDEIREGFAALLRKDLSVDGRSMERSLNGLQRDRVRAFGGGY